jgi:hypothetical protein
LAKYALLDNRDFNFTYFYSLLYIKLTNWGLHLWKGQTEDGRKFAHEIWVCRKWLKCLINDEAYDDAKEVAEAAFKKKYGFPWPESKIVFKEYKNGSGMGDIKMPFIFPKGYTKEQRKEMDAFITEQLRQSMKLEATLNNAYKEKFFELLKEGVDHWWD